MKLKNYHLTDDSIDLTLSDDTCKINFSIPFDHNLFRDYHSIPVPETYVSSFEGDVEDVEKSLRKEIKTLKWFVAEDDKRVLLMKALNAIAIILNLPLSANEIKIPNKRLTLVHYWEGVIKEETAKQLIAVISKSGITIDDIEEDAEDESNLVEENEEETIIKMGEIESEFEEDSRFDMGVIEDGN